MTVLHTVVPEGIDDPTQPSGGNVYDRKVCDGLAATGWSVHEHTVGGSWPHAEGASRAALTQVVQRMPDGAVVMVDGLIASAVPEILVPEARRLRLIVLVHMLLGHRSAGDGDIRFRECAVLSAAVAVVTTSAWARHRLLELYPVRADRVHVAEPAVDGADLVAGSVSGDALLCVAAVTADKGHDVLLDALAATADWDWQCVCVGSLDRDPAFVGSVRRRAMADGLGGRVTFTGPQTGVALDRAFAASDVLVLPSRAETYGMVVIEALARGLPVIAADVGGVNEALGRGNGSGPPGLLVPPDDAAALAAVLRKWLSNSELRERLRRAACERRESLPRWSTTTSAVAHVLTEAAS